MRKPLSVVAALALGLGLGFGLVSCKRGAPRGTAPDAITESYAAKNGLVTAHYPASFAASTVGASSIVLARNLPDGLDEALVIIPIERPITTDLATFARTVDEGALRDIHGYEASSSGPATCAGNPGIETSGSWPSVKGTLRYQRRACHFLKDGHGYSIAYSFPSTVAAEEEPKLRAVREATTFNR